MDIEPTADADTQDEDVVDKLRDLPVGTGDPNIVGDVGPTDTPPGADPPPPVGEDVPGEA